MGPQGAEQQEVVKPQPKNGLCIVQRRQENACIKGINTEIQNVAASVERQVGDNNSEMDSLSSQLPFDPMPISFARTRCVDYSTELEGKKILEARAILQGTS